MSGERRADIERIYAAAVRRVDPAIAVASTIVRDGSDVVVEGRRYAIPETGIYAIAIGKAAAAMLAGATLALGDSLIAAIGVAKHNPNRPMLRANIVVGAHPVPDERSLVAGRAVVEFAGTIPAGAIVFCLISGGGSALLEELKPGVRLEDIQHVTTELLTCGATIQELNAVRARLSNLKAGGLLQLLRHVTVINAIVSDVLGDDLPAIASGPTIPDVGDAKAESVLECYGVRAILPPASSGGSETNKVPQSVIVANVSIALDAAMEKATSLGYVPIILSRSVEGEARDVGAWFAETALALRSPGDSASQSICLLAGGETTVTVRGGGVGGRNSEAALAAAIGLIGSHGITLGCVATDGDDGDTGAAGGIVDGTTIAPIARAVALDALNDNDSFGFLSTMGSTFAPGPTGTNVNDLMIALVE